VNEQHERARLAERLRTIGHAFVAKELTDEDVRILDGALDSIASVLEAAEPRTHALPAGSWESFRMAVPSERTEGRKELFGDSIVSGTCNPMGLGAQLWRDGDEAVTEVSLGRAFEGAPQRAHGGMVAALIDETMGLILAIHEVLAFTVQLDITYRAPTPVGQPLLARARLDRRDGRKLYMSAEVTHDDVVVATATSIFVAVDPARFLAK
jgi:acyl-coenzyme A thioesterase PaaI-like protein